MYDKIIETWLIERIYVPVPADGVKGKTWGPSTAGGSTKVRPNIVDESGQNRFSKSAPSLEKSQRTLSIAPSVTSVPELGKYFQLLLIFDQVYILQLR